MNQPSTLEQLMGVTTAKRQLTIGLPAPTAGDKRFPLTPEAAGMLVARNFVVKMEQDAPASIHYPDLRYQQHGVEIVGRQEALRADIVIDLSPVSSIDVRGMKRGALLLTLYNAVTQDPDVALLLLKQHIITIALDRICDNNLHTPFADILAEIAGRASMALASSLLADAVNGKGILLGGIAGIVPCEVTILGSGIDACAAARSALGSGAMVRMFDNDVYRLRTAMRELGSGVVGSAMHPRVVVHALRTADVVVATQINPVYVITADIAKEMKEGVIAFDLSNGVHPVFPSMHRVDLGDFSPVVAAVYNGRVCYVNPGNAVPRTAAMALSNALLTMIYENFTSDGVNTALMLNAGLQQAVLTFLGKPVESKIAALVGMRQIDLKLILQFS